MILMRGDLSLAPPHRRNSIDQMRLTPIAFDWSHYLLILGHILFIREKQQLTGAVSFCECDPTIVFANSACEGVYRYTFFFYASISRREFV